jgi:hypothetical protein
MSTGNQSALADSSPRFLDAAGQEVAAQLGQTLPRQFALEPSTDNIEVSVGGGEKFIYTPDFLLRNFDTNETLPIGVKTPLSLSLASVAKLTCISAAYKEQGQDFLLLVWGHDHASGDASAKKNQLKDQGIHAMWVQDGKQAASQISDLFTVEHHGSLETD